MAKDFIFKTFDYCVNEEIEIDARDIVGTLPCEDESVIALVTMYGTWYEVNKQEWVDFGGSLEEVFDRMRREKELYDEDDFLDIVDELYEVGIFNDDEYEWLTV